MLRTARVTALRKAGSAIDEARATGSSPTTRTAVAPVSAVPGQPLLPWTTVLTWPVQPAFFTACAYALVSDFEDMPPPRTTSRAVFDASTARAAATTSVMTSLPSTPPPRNTVPDTVDGDAGACHALEGSSSAVPLYVNTRDTRSYVVPSVIRWVSTRRADSVAGLPTHVWVAPRVSASMRATELSPKTPDTRVSPVTRTPVA